LAGSVPAGGDRAEQAVVDVVGLGPGGADLLTAGTLDLLGSAATLRLRTARHPAVAEVPVLSAARTFDDRYERAATFDEVYDSVVESLVELAAAGGSVVYAVPGSPVVAERTVELLLADPRVRVRLHPALSFVDLAWVRLGVDPVELGVQLVDGHRFAERAAGSTGPFLVAQCDHPFVLSDVKLSVDEDPEVEVTVLHHLGLPDERIERIAWADLDRVEDADHLTSLFVPALAVPLGGEVVRLLDLVTELRRSDPWKAAQTHESLRRHLLEESHELFEAIDDYDPASGTGADELCAELGDVLYQVVFHAVVAAEAGWFTLTDVVAGIDAKLRRRRPPPGVVEEDPRAAQRRWERAKRSEPGRSSTFDGVPVALPALARALAIASKADAAGLAPPVGDLSSSVRALAEHPDDADRVADVLAAVVDVARAGGVDPEDALRRRTRRVEADLRAVERAAPGSHRPEA
jgi:tetrapyrrole methylase family protein/MazG family protein